MWAGARATALLPARVGDAHTSLVFRRPYRAAHASARSWNRLIRILASRATPFTLDQTTHCPFSYAPKMEYMVAVATRPHGFCLFNSLATY